MAFISAQFLDRRATCRVDDLGDDFEHMSIGIMEIYAHRYSMVQNFMNSHLLFDEGGIDPAKILQAMLTIELQSHMLEFQPLGGAGRSGEKCDVMIMNPEGEEYAAFIGTAVDAGDNLHTEHVLVPGSGGLRIFHIEDEVRDAPDFRSEHESFLLCLHGLRLRSG